MSFRAYFSSAVDSLPSFQITITFVIPFISFLLKLISDIFISGQESLSSHRSGFPVCCQPPFDVDEYIGDDRSRFDTLRFSALPYHQSALVVPYGPGSSNTAAETWSKQWKHCGGRGALELSAASVKRHFPFVRHREEDG